MRAFLWLVPLAVGSTMIGCTCSSTSSTKTCNNDALATGCTVGRCTISAPSRPLPSNSVSATVTEIQAPAEVGADALIPAMCNVDLPAGTAAGQVTLSVALDSAPDKAAVLFGWAALQGRVVTASGPVGSRVVGVVPESGSYGVTVRPGQWEIAGYWGADHNAAVDAPSLLRNLSNQSFTSAYDDGAHLYVGNGPRVLVYKFLLPASPGLSPDLILGQPDLQTTLTATSASLFGSSIVTALWSDGKRLAAASGSRVLVWNQIPNQTLAPADVVLGQPDFTTNKVNALGISATSLAGVAQIDSDGTRLIVADTLNHRVLGWSTFPTALGQPADFVLGQTSPTAATALAGAVPIYLPYGAAFAKGGGDWITSTGGIAFAHTGFANNPAADFKPFSWLISNADPGDPIAAGGYVLADVNGGVAVRDYGVPRILLTRGQPSSATVADFVLGQPDSSRSLLVRWGNTQTNNPSRVSASTFGTYPALGGGSGTFLVPDDRRLLIWDKAPTYNFEPATRVLGQAGFTVNERNDYRAVSGATLAQPADVVVKGAVAAVADRGNNRVLLFKTTDLGGTLPKAFAVVGQPDEKGYVANVDVVSPSAKTLSGPSGIALDGTHLVVADTENHRVLIWNSVPSSSGVAADLVLGQSDFSGRRPNAGRGDVNLDGYSDADADGFFYPTSVQSDGTHLFVVDRLNNRVLVWDTWPTTNGKPADRVIGQPDFKTVKPHRGAGAFTIAANGFNLPTAAALDGSSLWVADTENNRVVRWANVLTSPVPAAFVGQADGTTVSNANYRFDNSQFRGSPIDPPPATGAATVLRPRAVTIAAGKLFISEADSNRVHILDAGTFANVASLGQPSDTDRQPNPGGVTASGLAEPLGLAGDGSRLWVADSRNHRLVAFDLAALTTGAAAKAVVGQATLLTNGFNGSSLASDGTTSQPRGLAAAGDELYVADSANHRVVVLKAGDANALPVRILGQPNDTLALPNAGGAPSAHGLNNPRGVALDGQHVLVADTSNHRVVVFAKDGSAADATIVLGQKDFVSSAANSGGASASTLREPAGVCTDGTRVAVADAGNNRVLVWRTFPASGQPADLVLGQADFTATSGNRGDVPSLSTVAGPLACAFAGDALYVADTGNNRVLRWSSLPSGNGAAADLVLGQTDGVGRNPAATVIDLVHLAGPAALAFDGANLLVVDRDLSRVVQYQGALASGAKATDVLGGVGGPSLLRASGGIATLRGPLFTTRVFVSETSSDRVASVTPVSRLLP